MPRTSAPRASLSTARARTARILSALLALFFLVPFFGLIDLATLVGWVNPDYLWSVPLEVSWGSLFTFFVAGAFVWIAVRPARPWPGLVQLGIVSVSRALAAAATVGAGPLWVAAGIALSAALLAWLLRAPLPAPPT